ncbi:hypothetical protein Droror1_Dr00004450 [Drosera rotundifolia]
MFIPFNTLITELSSSFQSIFKTKQLHALISKTHLSLDPFFATRILRLYSLNGDIVSARNLFDEMPERTVFLWNSMIRAYARVNEMGSVFGLVRAMMGSETMPDNYTFACLIRACADWEEGLDGVRVVHGGVLVFGYGADGICGSAVVSGYSRLGRVEEARKVFSRVRVRDLAMWNSMISGNGYCGFWDDGLRLFRDMRSVGMEPDGYTMVALLLGLVDHGLLGIGKSVHAFCVKSSFDYNGHVDSSLVSMYSRCSCLDSAHKVFRDLLKPDLVTWSSLITGLSQCGDSQSALHLFREMNMERGLRADGVLVASALAASAQLVSVKLGYELHGYVLRHALDIDVMVSSALIDMYFKCGFVDLAMRFFESLPHKNIVTYNSVILGFGSHGLASQAFWIFNRMLDNGLYPDASTFSSLLHVCSHSGLLEDGKHIFSRMQYEFRLEPMTEHCVHMVKILGMAGELKEAYNLVLSLPEPVDDGIWGALLGCCETQGDSRLAESISQHAIESRPEKSSYTVSLSKMYANDGRWEEMEMIRDGVTYSRVRKMAGISWVSDMR